MVTPVMTEASGPGKEVQGRRSIVRAGTPLRPALSVLFLASLASAALLWASHFPLACGWLGWVALVPLLCLVRTPLTGWRIYLCAWVAGLGFFWPVLQWMRVADERMYYTWAALATYCSLYFPLAIFLLRRLDRATALPMTLTVPVIWTGLDYFRGNFIGGFATLIQGNAQHNYPGGFPWYFLGYTQQALLPVIQIADLGGVYAVTFLVATVNGLIFELLSGRRWFRYLQSLPAGDETGARRRIPLAVQIGGVFVIMGAAVGYGLWRLGQHEFETGPRVAFLQGNLDQRIRNNTALTDQEGEHAREVVAKHYGDLCIEAADANPRPNLIVWPETSFADEWANLLPTVPAEKVNPILVRNLVQLPCEEVGYLAKKTDTNLLIGTTVQEWDIGPTRGVWKVLRPAGRYNSALLIDRLGRNQARYDKIVRVPFGEYVPLRDAIPWLNNFAPYDFDYSVQPGENFTRFALGSFHFGVVICYEDTDPWLARQYVRPGGGQSADFLINISNDGWFNGTSEHEEHLAICRFRAIECRRAVARAVNMGISAIIDGNGRVCALPGPTWAESKKVTAVVAGNIPIDRRMSLYARWGDWLPWACWVLIGIGLIAALLRCWNAPQAAAA